MSISSILYPGFRNLSSHRVTVAPWKWWPTKRYGRKWVIRPHPLCSLSLGKISIELYVIETTFETYLILILLQYFWCIVQRTIFVSTSILNCHHKAAYPWEKQRQYLLIQEPFFPVCGISGFGHCIFIHGPAVDLPIWITKWTAIVTTTTKHLKWWRREYPKIGWRLFRVRGGGPFRENPLNQSWIFRRRVPCRGFLEATLQEVSDLRLCQQSRSHFGSGH